MTTIERAAKTVRYTARDLGTRIGALDYRPLRWSAERWSDSYADRLTDGYGAVDEAARYGLLLGYLAWIEGEPSLLDVGCGAGLVRSRLGLLPFSSYVGVDPTPEAIAQAQALSDDRTSFVVGDPMEMDPGRFDVVICSEVLYFAPDPLALIDRMGTFLAPGGHILTSIWRHPGDVTLWRALDDRYRLVDRSTARNRANRLAPRGWAVACHRHRD